MREWSFRLHRNQRFHLGTLWSAVKFSSGILRKRVIKFHGLMWWGMKLHDGLLSCAYNHTKKTNGWSHTELLLHFLGLRKSVIRNFLFTKSQMVIASQKLGQAESTPSFQELTISWQMKKWQMVFVFMRYSLMAYKTCSFVHYYMLCYL